LIGSAAAVSLAGALGVGAVWVADIGGKYTQRVRDGNALEALFIPAITAKKVIAPTRADRKPRSADVDAGPFGSGAKAYACGI